MHSFFISRLSLVSESSIVDFIVILWQLKKIYHKFMLVCCHKWSTWNFSNKDCIFFIFSSEDEA